MMPGLMVLQSPFSQMIISQSQMIVLALNKSALIESPTEFGTPDLNESDDELKPMLLAFSINGGAIPASTDNDNANPWLVARLVVNPGPIMRIAVDEEELLHAGLAVGQAIA